VNGAATSRSSPVPGPAFIPMFSWPTPGALGRGLSPASGDAGWEWLWVSHEEGGRRYWHGRIYRRAVTWPRKVKLVADEP
jgi:hypothetical protein